MTMYEPNPDVRETGAEVDEFVDAPDSLESDPPSPRTPDDTNEASPDDRSPGPDA